MKNNIALGLGILALILSVFTLLPKQAQVKVATLGSVQSYPVHFTANATALDTIFSWGGIENAGVSWLTGAVNASSTLTVAGATSLQSAVTLGGHLISGGGTPTVAVGGSGFTAGVLSGNDTAGVVSSTVAANAGQITVNFASAFASAPRCVISPTTIQTVSSTVITFVTSSVNSFSINYIAGALVQSNNWNYLCVQ